VLIPATFKSKFKKISYSQCGEDLIVQYIFNVLGKKNPTYWDVGAYHPYHISNTALLYENGSRGINIEPNPDSIGLFRRYRKNDINVNSGVSDKEGKGQYFCMEIPTLNTFSKSEAEHFVNEGHKITASIELSLFTMRQISSQFFNNSWPDFLSLDVEGLDFDILKSIPFSEALVSVICVESISYSATRLGVKNQQLVDYLVSQGYVLYADTFVNSIFVKESLWKK
jgi:FkbM family methyltransferase